MFGLTPSFGQTASLGQSVVFGQSGSGPATPMSQKCGQSSSSSMFGAGASSAPAFGQALQDQPKVIQPLNYECVVDQRKDQMDSDPLRDLLLCPQDDVMMCNVPRQMSTMVPSGPQNAEQEAQSLFAKECIKTYNSSGYIMDYKYKAYSGDFCMLPSKDQKIMKLSAHGFGIEDEDSTSQRGGIRKQGWLQPFIHIHLCFGSESHCLTPSLVPLRKEQKRFFQLSSLPNGSYILNSYRDQSCKDLKESSCIDSCIHVLQYPKLPNGFLLQKKEHSDICLVANSQADMREWMEALRAAQERSSQTPEDRRHGEASQDLSVPHFMHYRQLAWETDQLNGGRPNMLCLDPETQKQFCSGMDVEVESFSFSQRILVSCHDPTFNPQGCVSETGDGVPTNVEPFSISLALFDVSKSCKISADFHVDREMQLTDASRKPSTKGIFSVTNPHADIFLVARVEKFFQNSIAHCIVPYTNMTQEVQKCANPACQHLSQYRMPYAWAAKKVFKDPQGNLDVDAKFSPLYCQNIWKSEKSLSDKSKPQTIPGQLNITVECVPSDLPNTVTSSYVPVRPLEEGCESVSVEIEEFLPKELKGLQVPFNTYENKLYIYPQQLKYSKHKAFAKGKNITVCIQLRDSDDHSTSPLKCIYGHPGETLFTSSAYAAVLRNKRCTEIYDEIKMELPVHVHKKHHLRFTFYIDCEVNSCPGCVPVGFSWMPVMRLLTEGRRKSADVSDLPVTTTLPPGYLGDKLPPDIKQEDNAMLTVKTHVASTIYTQDQHLHNFFEHCQLMRTTSDVDTAKLIIVVKALHATKKRVIINFLPTVLKQLFEVLAMATKDTLRAIVHIVSLCHDKGVERYLQKFLKCCTESESMTSNPSGSCHQVLAMAITAMLEQTHDLIRDSLLKYSWFFFESLAKLMVLYLQEGSRMKMPRAERFPDSFHQTLHSLLLSVLSHVNQRHEDIPEEVRCVNKSLATFIKRCMTFMDRRFAFSLLNDYMHGITNLKDNQPSQVLSELKLDFLVRVCNHEHYIPLNLPMALGSRTLVQEFSLTTTKDYYSNHFLVGLLLREVEEALQQSPPVPKLAVTALKNLLIKHAMDGRYTVDKEQQARICLLYLPLLELLYQNLKQISAQPSMSSPDALQRRGSSTGPLLARQSETRGLLQCFLHIVRTLSKYSLMDHWKQLSTENISNFLSLMEMCQVQFCYIGKKNTGRSQLLTWDRKSQNLDAMPSTMSGLVKTRVQQFSLLTPNTGTGPSEATDHHQALLDGNMSTEASLTVLDVLSVFTDCFKTQLLDSDGHNPLMMKVFDLYLTFLKVSQSEAALGHVFTALKAFISNFPSVLFSGPVTLCSALCYEAVKVCMSQPASLSSEASALLYLLIRTNYQFTSRKSFLRTDVQIIESMNQLISDVTVTEQMREHVLESLSIINSLAKSDISNFSKSDESPAFPVEVLGLTQRVRTVLKVSTHMKEHKKDPVPESLLELQDGLARSYASTPQLRCHWLQSMAQAHHNNGDMTEAAMCYVHTAALVAEYLHRKKLFPSGVVAFLKITSNVHEEAAMMEDTQEDTGMQDSYYTEGVLVGYLERCVEALIQAERYELLIHVASLLSPINHDGRHFKKLGDMYGKLKKAYEELDLRRVTQKFRHLGTYYRVAFYGDKFQKEDRKQYVYKEPRITSLPEILNRLELLYGEKFGAENVQIIQDSDKVEPESLDPEFSYIQLTCVQPYFEEEEAPKTDFELHHDINRFMFETPYTLAGRKHGCIEDQWKRRTVLTTSNTFPYVKKRVEVVEQEEQELDPLSVAIDEVRKKTSTLKGLCKPDDVNMILLQLELSGCVAAKVNSGPVGYAKAFLADGKPSQSTKEAKELKERFRQLVQVCRMALDINESVIGEDQLEYHKQLKNEFNTMEEELSPLIN